MEAENINIFYDTLKETFQDVLGAEVERGDLGKSQVSDLVDKTNVYIEIHGGLEGYFYLSLPEGTALQIAEGLAGRAPEGVNDFAKSAVSEVANMIMGKVSSKFFDQGVELNSDTPEVVAQADEGDVDLFGETFILIPVSTDMGDLGIHIFLE